MIRSISNEQGVVRRSALSIATAEVLREHGGSPIFTIGRAGMMALGDGRLELHPEANSCAAGAGWPRRSWHRWAASSPRRRRAARTAAGRARHARSLADRERGRRVVVRLGEAEHLLARRGDRHGPDADVPALCQLPAVMVPTPVVSNPTRRRGARRSTLRRRCRSRRRCRRRRGMTAARSPGPSRRRSRRAPDRRQEVACLSGLSIGS